jgi:uncharacterized phiE125 gp8 family phage protein
MRHTLLTPPTREPVTVADAKLAARLDGDHWDAIVAPAIAAARQVAEHQTGQRFMQQTWRTELAAWPTVADMLPYYTPTSVAVSYWATTNEWVTLPPNQYVWAAINEGTALAPALGLDWPALGDVALGPRVRVDVTLGATAEEHVPPAAATFIKALVSVMVADPSLTAMAALDSSVYLPRILDPVRLYG